MKRQQGILNGEWRAWPHAKNYKGLITVNVIRPAASASWQLWKLGIHLPRDREMKDLFFLIILQRNGFRFLRQTFGSYRRYTNILKGQRKDSQLQALFNECSKKTRWGQCWVLAKTNSNFFFFFFFGQLWAFPKGNSKGAVLSQGWGLWLLEGMLEFGQASGWGFKGSLHIERFLQFSESISDKVHIL